MKYSGFRQDDLLSIQVKTYHKSLKTNIINKLYVCHYVSLRIVNQFIKTFYYNKDIRNLAYLLSLAVIVKQHRTNRQSNRINNTK